MATALLTTLLTASAVMAFPSPRNLIMRGADSIIGNDSRTMVPVADTYAGEKYGSITKILFSNGSPCRKKRPCSCTGYLVRPDVMVTAGHCAFERNRATTEMDVYIGYHGVDDLDDPKVQKRRATKIVVSQAWVDNFAAGPPAISPVADVAFVLLNEGFNGVTPYKYSSTPVQFSAEIAIPGYPGDRVDSDNPLEIAAEMYVGTGNVTVDLKKSCYNMLAHDIDTFAGDSGAPVIRIADNTVIGTHVDGSGGEGSRCGNHNAASTVGTATVGPDFDRLLQALFKTEKTDGVAVVKSNSVQISVAKPTGGS